MNDANGSSAKVVMLTPFWCLVQALEDLGVLANLVGR